MATKKPRSQIFDLLLHVAEQLDVESDRDLADLAGVSVDNVDNWKSGASQELKGQTLAALKEGIAARIHALKERARVVEASNEIGLIALEIEEDSGPAALQRQFHDRVSYDYLGHRFLYFEPQGALAWENMMRSGYDQSCWLSGVGDSGRKWLESTKDGPKGALAKALGFRRGAARGLDVISLGPGEAAKEALVLKSVLAEEHHAQQKLAWLSMALIDVSIPLLLKGAKTCRALLQKAGRDAAVLPFCADFEEGGLTFLHRLPSTKNDGGVRLVMMLGNVFGNVRDEEVLLRERIMKVVRPGDFLWLEVATALERVEDDPLYAVTQSPEGSLSAPEWANRRLLLEGPYRRYEAARGGRTQELYTRVWVRIDDEASRVPKSVNFCHDLVFKEERRACTILYTRRYDIPSLSKWLEGQGFDVESVELVDDSQKRSRVAHVLARRRA